MNTLHILDLMPFVHAGHVNKYSVLEDYEDAGSKIVIKRTPTGGTSLVFNTLYDIVGKGDIVICSDREPTIKKTMDPNYKSSRSHDHNIVTEQHAAEYILQQCGITVLASPGYEADDYIYSLVRKYHDMYDKIYVYTGDSDLYFLVDDVVSIRPSSSRAKTVDISNYETTKIHGNVYQYNTITMSKILGGDSSDDIPALPKHVQQKLFTSMYQKPLFPLMGDKKTVQHYVSIFAPEALPQVDLVFPLEVEELPATFGIPNIDAIKNWGSAINNKHFRNMASSSFDPTLHIKRIQSEGWYEVKEDF